MATATAPPTPVPSAPGNAANGDAAGIVGGSGILFIQACALIPGLLPCVLLAVVLALPLVLPLFALGLVAGVVIGVPVVLARLVRRVVPRSPTTD